MRNAALRKRPKTCLPARVRREHPKRPKMKIAVFHYTVSKNTTKRHEKGTPPAAPRRALEGPFDAKKGSERIPFKSDPPRAPQGPPQGPPKEPPRTPKSCFWYKNRCFWHHVCSAARDPSKIIKNHWENTCKDSVALVETSPLGPPLQRTPQGLLETQANSPPTRREHGLVKTPRHNEKCTAFILKAYWEIGQHSFTGHA